MYTCIYIYIYREREREGEIVHMCAHTYHHHINMKLHMCYYYVNHTVWTALFTLRFEEPRDNRRQHGARLEK